MVTVESNQFDLSGRYMLEEYQDLIYPDNHLTIYAESRRSGKSEEFDDSFVGKLSQEDAWNAIREGVIPPFFVQRAKALKEPFLLEDLRKAEFVIKDWARKDSMGFPYKGVDYKSVLQSLLITTDYTDTLVLHAGVAVTTKDETPLVSNVGALRPDEGSRISMVLRVRPLDWNIGFRLLTEEGKWVHYQYLLRDSENNALYMLSLGVPPCIQGKNHPVALGRRNKECGLRLHDLSSIERRVGLTKSNPVNNGAKRLDYSETLSRNGSVISNGKHMILKLNPIAGSVKG